MKASLILLFCIQLLLISCGERESAIEQFDKTNSGTSPKYAIVLHGGAGFYEAGKDSTLDNLYLQSLQRVLKIGDSLLSLNYSAIDVVEYCIQSFEDDTLFNAGRGSVLNEDRVVSMDASIMNGLNEKAGAVAGLSTTRHPITAARRVMDSTVHVFLSGDGADKFAHQQGLEMMNPDWFIVTKSKTKYQEELVKIKNAKFGTVGCVVLDKARNLAAGTSTGGMTMKKWGRIGDAPIIGAGNYASNTSCAISCTGHGEYFIRNVVAYDVAARMNYLKEPIDSAAQFIIENKLSKQEAKGGLIGVDRNGNITMRFNTPAMFRAYLKEGEPGKAFIQ